MALNWIMFIKSFLCESGGDTFLFNVELLIVCLMFFILSLKKEANSLHLSVERSSEVICAGGLVSLSTDIYSARIDNVFVDDVLKERLASTF